MGNKILVLILHTALQFFSQIPSLFWDNQRFFIIENVPFCCPMFFSHHMGSVKLMRRNPVVMWWKNSDITLLFLDPTKYFGCELGAQTQIDLKNERYIVNGSHDAEKLQDILDGFIEKFVLCPDCDNPETVLVCFFTLFRVLRMLVYWCCLIMQLKSYNYIAFKVGK